MSRINYDQPIRIGGQSDTIHRSENFGEDWIWRTFKLYSAMFLWLLGGIFLIAGGAWFYSRFYFNGPPPLPTSMTSTTTTSSTVIPPVPPTVAPPVVVLPSPPSVIRVDIPRIEVEVNTPPLPSVAVDPTTNMTPEERRQYRVWVLRE